MIKEDVRKFIREDNYSDTKIRLFIDDNNLNEYILIEEAFKDINRNTTSHKIIINNKEFILNGINLLITLCSYRQFNKNEVELYKLKIKQIREKLLYFLNDNEDPTIRLACNKLDEIVFGKSDVDSKIIAIIKEAIDNKEDVENIKKLIYLNKEETILKQSILFDYVFYKALNSIESDDLYINYYITLLKIFYNSNIKKEHYLSDLSKYYHSIYVSEIYNIIYGDKRSLSLDEIIAKYDKGTTQCNFNYPREKYLYVNDKNIVTIDNEKCAFRDDALSLTKDGSNYVIGLYMSDVGSCIPYDSDLDIEARTIFENSYLLNRKIMMLPKNISGSFSLNKAKNRNVIALYVIVDASGKIKDYYVKKECICTNNNFSYVQADHILDDSFRNNFLFDLYALSLYLDINANVDRYKYESKSKSMVNFYSILCNKIIGEISKTGNIPMVYTARTKVNSIPKFKDAGIELDDRAREILRSLKTYEFFSTEPLLQYKLGIEGYTKIKSALRRYPDLYNQYLFHKYYFKDKDFDDSNIEKMVKYFNFKEFEGRLFEEEYNRKAQILGLKRH